jgi:hypothetical protein
MPTVDENASIKVGARTTSQIRDDSLGCQHDSLLTRHNPDVHKSSKLYYVKVLSRYIYAYQVGMSNQDIRIGRL